MAGGTAGELDGSRQLPSYREGKELDRMRVSLARGRPYGADGWVMGTASHLGLQHTVRLEGGSIAWDGVSEEEDDTAGGDLQRTR